MLAEQDSLSPAVTAHVVKIPTRFCVNVSVAAAIVMYDRMVSLGRFASVLGGRTGDAVGPTSSWNAEMEAEALEKRLAKANSHFRGWIFSSVPVISTG